MALPPIISLPPPTMPLITPDGKIERAWYLCLRQIIENIGATVAAPVQTPADLQALLADDSTVGDSAVPALLSEVAALQAQTLDRDLIEYPSIRSVQDAFTVAQSQDLQEYPSIQSVQDAFTVAQSQDLQEYPSIQSVKDTFTVAMCALEYEQ